VGRSPAEGRPARLIKRLNGELARIIALCDVLERYASLGMTPLKEARSAAPQTSFTNALLGRWQ
jgi:hypothetical protein